VLASRVWWSLPESGWREAFSDHPRIGNPVSGVAAAEQSSARTSSPQLREALALANLAYERRFGWIFLVCASGKSAHEVLALCAQRLHNDPTTELRVAATEQEKITRLRLERMAQEE